MKFNSFLKFYIQDGNSTRCLNIPVEEVVWSYGQYVVHCTSYEVL
jgi:hypothetical protein